MDVTPDMIDDILDEPDLDGEVLGLSSLVFFALPTPSVTRLAEMTERIMINKTIKYRFPALDSCI